MELWRPDGTTERSLEDLGSVRQVPSSVDGFSEWPVSRSKFVNFSDGGYISRDTEYYEDI